MENRKKKTSIYTKTIVAAFVPFLTIFLVGICGLTNNYAIAIAIAFVTIPTFYYITKDSSAKEKWIQLPIINKDGKVVYNGYLSNRPWIFAYHPRKFLK